MPDELELLKRKVAELEALQSLYKDGKTFAEEIENLSNAVKGSEKELKLAKEKVIVLQDEFAKKQYALLELQQKYHKAGSLLVLQAQDYAKGVRKGADVFVENAKKLQTQADNQRQLSDDLLKSAKEKEAKASKLLQEAQDHVKVKSRR